MRFSVGYDLDSFFSGLYKGSTHILYIANIHTITFQIITTELSKKKRKNLSTFPL